MAATNVRLSDAIQEYLAHRKAAGMKTNTVRNDECYLLQFLTHAGNLYVRSVGAVHVDTFFAQGSERWGTATLNLITTTLKGFFRFCRQRKWMNRDEDPTSGYRTRKVAKKEMLRIPVTDFARVLDTAEHPRDRVLISLGLFLFLRASEVKLLRIGDVDLELGEIAVRVPKSDDYDIMRINPQLDRELRKYLTWYTETHGALNPDWYLVPGKNSLAWQYDHETKRLVPDTTSGKVRLRPSRPIYQPERAIQAILEKCGYPTYWQGVHTLRRSGARAFYDELCDRAGDNSALEVVSSMLHHANLVITQRYLGIAESRKRRDRAVMDGPMFPALEAAPQVTPLRIAEPGG